MPKKQATGNSVTKNTGLVTLGSNIKKEPSERIITKKQVEAASGADIERYSNTWEGTDMANIDTRKVMKDKIHLGWKVYIAGEKFPKKPQDFYGVIAEEDAVKRAWNDYNTIALTKKGLTNIGLDDSGEEL